MTSHGEWSDSPRIGEIGVGARECSTVRQAAQQRNQPLRLVGGNLHVERLLAVSSIATVAQLYQTLPIGANLEYGRAITIYLADTDRQTVRSSIVVPALDQIWRSTLALNLILFMEHAVLERRAIKTMDRIVK